MVYGRKVDSAPAEQKATHVVVGARQVAHFPGDLGAGAHRLAVPLAEQAYELELSAAPAGLNGLYTTAELNAAFEAATEVPYEATATGGQKRLLGSAIHTYYDSASLPAALPEGTADAKALPHESHGLSLMSLPVAFRGILTRSRRTARSAALSPSRASTR